MHRILTIAAIVLAGPASAQPAEQRIDVTLSSFKFDPATIRLHHGQRYLLHFVNASGGGHDFVAKTFFAAATLAPAERAKLKGDGIALDGEATQDVHIVAPAAGSYPVKCTHFMHAAFGMKGTIVVD